MHDERGTGESGDESSEPGWVTGVEVSVRTALGVVAVVAVAVAVGILGGLFLADSPATGGAATATPAPTTPAAPATATASPTATPEPTPTGTLEPAVSPVAVEVRIVERVNYLRAGRGYDRLPPNGSLREVARSHSEAMARGEYVGHEGPDGGTLPDRLDRFSVECGSSAETVGRVTFGAPVRAADGSTVTYETAEEVGNAVVRRWMNDAAPRNDILRREWTQAGVGVEVVEANEGALVYATLVLCER